MGYILAKIVALEGGRAEKIRFSVPMAVGSGAELATGAAGRYRGERWRRRGGLVRFNSKSYIVMLLIVLFNAYKS